MIIRFRPIFQVENFPSGYPAISEWIGLMKRIIGSGEERHYADGIYTDRFYDLVLLGDEIAEGKICPVDVVVRLNRSEYLYGPEGDLHRIGTDGNGPEVIRLSTYAEST